MQHATISSIRTDTRKKQLKTVSQEKQLSQLSQLQEKQLSQESQLQEKQVSQEKQLNQPQLNQPKQDQNDTQWDDIFDQMFSDEPVILNTLPNAPTTMQPIEKPKTDERLKCCQLCGGKLRISVNIMCCLSCGVESHNISNITEEEYSVSAADTCNVNPQGFMSVRVVGSYGCQRSLLKTCANYGLFRKNLALKDMNNWNAQSNGIHIPKSVISEANEMFALIKDAGYVFRKDGRKGVMSACIYYACYRNGISKTPSEIAAFSGIEEKFHSQGDRVLHDLNEKKIISIPARVNPIPDYVDRYLELLEINKIYKPFIIDLIDCAEKKRIHIMHDSKHSTKCVGAIYMLVDRVPDLRCKISKEKIDQICGISKTTFIRYYNVLCEYYKLIKRVFKKHGIPMKNEWRKKRQ